MLEVQLKWIGSNKHLGNIIVFLRSTKYVRNGWTQARDLQQQVAKLIPTSPDVAGICVYDANHTALTLHPAYYRWGIVRGGPKEHPAKKKASATLNQAWEALFRHALDRQAVEQPSASMCPVVWHVTQYSNADAVSVENWLQKHGVFAQ